MRVARLLDDAADLPLDKITALARRSLGVPLALLSFVTDTEQSFKSVQGGGDEWRSRRRTPLTHSLCLAVVRHDDALRIVDGKNDASFCTHPAITNLGIDAYLGVPVHGPDGQPLGSLCAIDTHPRSWSDDDEATLRDLADLVETEIGMRLSVEQHRDIEQRLQLALQAASMGTWIWRLDEGQVTLDAREAALFGLEHSASDWDESAVLARIHPDDAVTVREAVARALAGDEKFDSEFRVVDDAGNQTWLAGRGQKVAGAVERVMIGVNFDITQRKTAERQRDLHIEELTHRLKNVLAVVQAIVRQTLRHVDDPAEFVVALSGRLNALASSHARLWKGTGQAASLRALIEGEMASIDSTRVDIRGVDVEVTSTLTLKLTLILHELATNAIKHGALSNDDGRVSISWQRHDDHVRLDWRESGGPPVLAPQRRGFGTTLIAGGLGHWGESYLAFELVRAPLPAGD